MSSSSSTVLVNFETMGSCTRMYRRIIYYVNCFHLRSGSVSNEIKYGGHEYSKHYYRGPKCLCWVLVPLLRSCVGSLCIIHSAFTTFWWLVIAHIHIHIQEHLLLCIIIWRDTHPHRIHKTLPHPPDRHHHVAGVLNGGDTTLQRLGSWAWI